VDPSGLPVESESPACAGWEGATWRGPLPRVSAGVRAGGAWAVLGAGVAAGGAAPTTPAVATT
jgi:hypothetical protein